MGLIQSKISQKRPKSVLTQTNRGYIICEDEHHLSRHNLNWHVFLPIPFSSRGPSEMQSIIFDWLATSTRSDLIGDSVLKPLKRIYCIRN